MFKTFVSLLSGHASYMEQWWSDTDGTKPKTSERNLFQCHIVHQKFLMNWTGVDPGSPQRYPCAKLCVFISRQAIVLIPL